MSWFGLGGGGEEDVVYPELATPATDAEIQRKARLDFVVEY